MRRMLSILLAAALLLSCLSVAVLAASGRTLTYELWGEDTSNGAICAPEGNLNVLHVRSGDVIKVVYYITGDRTITTSREQNQVWYNSGFFALTGEKNKTTLDNYETEIVYRYLDGRNYVYFTGTRGHTFTTAKTEVGTMELQVTAESGESTILNTDYGASVGGTDVIGARPIHLLVIIDGDGYGVNYQDSAGNFIPSLARTYADGTVITLAPRQEERQYWDFLGWRATGTGGDGQLHAAGGSYTVTGNVNFVPEWKVWGTPAAPDVTGKNVTSVGARDGKLNGLTTAMEYRLQGADDWTPCTDPNVGLPAGVYEVRYKEDSAAHTQAGEIRTATIGTDLPPSPSPTNNGGGNGGGGGGGTGGGGGGISTPATNAITVNPTTNGSVMASHTSAAQGTTVTLTATPASGYELGTITARNANGGTVTLSGSGNTRTFTMPNSAVTVTATFRQTTGANTISILPASGGQVNSDKLIAALGDTVTLTAAPSNGYLTASMVVRDANGSTVTLTAAGSGRYTFVMPGTSVTVQGIFARPAATTAETGVSRYLNDADHISYINGYPEGDVQPGGNITRAEVSVILYRLLKYQNTVVWRGFPDVPKGEWYTDAIEMLASMQIVNGYLDGTFQPKKPITRAEFATMMTRFAYATGGSMNFNDVPDDFWGKDAISTAADYGWVTGYEDGTFRPNTSITRAEAVTIINRMLNRSADVAWASEHRTELRQFSDLQNPAIWYYYDMVEAINAHGHSSSGADEKWTGLK